MRGQTGRRRSQAGGGLLFVVVAVLLVAPTLFAVALVNLAGPATRAALAGDDPADLGEPASAVIAPSPRDSAADGAIRPLSGVESDDDGMGDGLAPIFEPRVGRFGLSEADPDLHEDHAGHAPDAVDAAQAEQVRRQTLSGAAGGGAVSRAVPAAQAPEPTPWPAGPARASAELPILMYHHTGPLPANPDTFRRDLTVSPTLFEEQLESLADSGIQTVTLDRLFEHLEGRQPLPTRAVALTFDDGYADNYEVAFPLLKKHGMVGTFFVTTGLVGRPGYMTWEQLEELAAAGMAIEAHSISHADLTKVAPTQLASELAVPKQQIEERLSRPARFLAYPGGRFDPTVIRAARAAGYKAAVTTQHGLRHTAAGPYELGRVRVRGTESVEQLVAKLTPSSWRALARQP